MSVLEGVNLGFGRRLPMVLQTEGAECGLACVAMIAGYLGHHTDLSELRRRYSLSLKGATLKDIVGIADRIGLASRPLRVEMAELPMLRTPCILHWDLNHFVVLKRIKRNAVVIHDPAAGVRHLSHAEVSRHFTGIVLELTPTGGFETATPAPRMRVRSLLGRLVGLKRSLALLLALALAIEVFALISPLFMAWVVDHALVSADFDLLLTLALAFSLLLIIRTAVTAMRGWMVIVLSASLQVQARANLLSHLISLPASYF
jgi:ATP-binding cassette, subfamily B, bacterial CvaB/MchF/RaxB